jgi:ATP-dependent NAD(P)H-hydrate dehydratase
MASAKLGCDMSHVICERSAASVIKSYSPSLMVHPLLPSSESVSDPNSIDAPALASPIISMLSRLHALVIGPGLGRDGVTLKVVREVIKEAQSQSIPFVLDADGLLLVTEDPGLVKGYKECILTPNVNEFGRLAKALKIEVQSQAQIKGDDGDKTSKESEACERLSNALGGVTIIQKGPHDIISNGVMDRSAHCLPGEQLTIIDSGTLGRRRTTSKLRADRTLRLSLRRRARECRQRRHYFLPLGLAVA